MPPAGKGHALCKSGTGSGACTDVSAAAAVCYNPANQITELRRSNPLYAFAAVYNVNRNYTANGLNQYTAIGSLPQSGTECDGITATIGYDCNGNLTKDGLNTFLYDTENRLVSAMGVKNATLRYDPLGRLYEVAANGSITRLLHGGDELMAEYDGAGNLLRREACPGEGRGPWRRCQGRRPHRLV